MSRILPTAVFQIGRILVKKCRRCEVTRELERFSADDRGNGGVRDECGKCEWQQQAARNAKRRQQQASAVA